jgi:spermidine synthase
MKPLRSLFALAVLLAAFLLFLVEPMAAKQLLPSLGGSAAVWITCLVFFQTALLVAYLYAHWQASRPRWMVHILLLVAAAISAIAWAVHTSPLKAVHPVASIFAALSITIGLPFLMLGATSPLLQVWIARITTGGIPWRLYALSNLASLIALALYPSLVEPVFTLRAQRILWAAGFVAFALLTTVLSLRVRSLHAVDDQPATLDESQFPAASLRQKLLWVLLPMVAAMQLSAVTAYLTANVAAIPLLWILPLGVYLVTLILAFQFPQLLPRGIIARFMVVMLAGLAYMLSQTEVSIPIRMAIAFFLIEVFFSCLFCHTEAYALRPQRTSQSTLFYLSFAAGGALGSFLIGIASPLLFDNNYDLALTFFATAALALAVYWSAGWQQRLLWSVAGALLIALVVMLHTAYQRNTPYAERNFYGSLRVRQAVLYPGPIIRTLTNGTIQHGTQIFSDQLRRKPTTYYGEDSGIGLALNQCCTGRTRNIGVVGLGTGTIAAYGHPGDHITFYEINPAVPIIAHSLFTYIRESPASVQIVEGDARASLASEPAENFDVLVIDAFNGDAIPMHLLTAQAMALYRRHLAPGGIIAFHISNQHVDLEPEIALLAQSAGMQVKRVSNPANEDAGVFSSTWMLASNNASFFADPLVAARARDAVLRPGLKLWTDDYSTLLPILR